jgi:hypothetical protein
VTPEAVEGVFEKYFPSDRYTVVTLVPAAKEEEEHKGSLEGLPQVRLESGSASSSRTASRLAR